MAHTDAEILEAVKRCGSNNKAAAELGIGRRSVDKRMAKYAAVHGYSPQHDMVHTVPDGFKVKGVSTLYKPDGSVGAQWVKSTADLERQKEMMEAMIRAFCEELPKLPKRKRVAKGYLKDLSTVYPIGDAHIGMRAWAAECGKDWDLAIAERTQCGVMNLLVDKVLPTETATVIDLGDWIHQDSIAAVTPRSGHNLDADGRYAKIIHVAIKVMRQCIESALDKHKTVHVISIPGNHNETGALWMSAALSHMYENEPNVTIETQPSLFAYFEFGKNLVGVHHGHTCKMAQLPAVMAADKPEAWGRTKFRYWYTGHIHHQQIQEFPGCTVESFNTLASNDAYATAGGWRSRENMKAIYLHREWGEVTRETAHPAMLEVA